MAKVAQCQLDQRRGAQGSSSRPSAANGHAGAREETGRPEKRRGRQTTRRGSEHSQKATKARTQTNSQNTEGQANRPGGHTPKPEAKDHLQPSRQASKSPWIAEHRLKMFKPSSGPRVILHAGFTSRRMWTPEGHTPRCARGGGKREARHPGGPQQCARPGGHGRVSWDRIDTVAPATL